MKPHDLLGRELKEKQLVVVSMGDDDRHIALGVVSFVNDKTGTVDVDVYYERWVQYPEPRPYRFMYPANQLLIQDVSILRDSNEFHRIIIKALS